MNGKRWVVILLLFGSASVLGATYHMGIGDDCDLVVVCFYPNVLTINAGDSVVFYNYAENRFTGPHNVVADDGSFRCANGCDGEGGNGTPVDDAICNGSGCHFLPGWTFTRQFNVPGIVKFHDEVSHASGTIIVEGAQATLIGAEVTGTWYNPAQGGHGFMLEVLQGTPMQLLASWFVFAPEGGQSWIVGLGPINGNRAVVQGMQALGSGGRFPPNFDRANIVDAPWGTLTFSFTDCNHGHVDWDSTIPGYASGGMDLVRLTLPAGLSCSN